MKWLLAGVPAGTVIMILLYWFCPLMLLNGHILTIGATGIDGVHWVGRATYQQDKSHRQRGNYGYVAINICPNP